MSDHDGATPATTRRRVLAFTGAGAAALAAGATGPAAAVDPDYGGWFEGVSNYDGTVDRTGQDEVTVSVGASGNGGNFAFGPAAVHVDPGTTVVWEWTGKGSAHNVSAADGSFESETTAEAGHTFERTFDEQGVVKYVCTPHEQMGMKGAVVVGDPAAAAGGGMSREDLLAVGGGLGLAGTLLGIFAAGTRRRGGRQPSGDGGRR